MPEGRDSKSVQGKEALIHVGKPNTYYRAAINRRSAPKSALPLPRLRSAVNTNIKGNQGDQVNTFLPKYFKQTKLKGPLTQKGTQKGSSKLSENTKGKQTLMMNQGPKTSSANNSQQGAKARSDQNHVETEVGTEIRDKSIDEEKNPRHQTRPPPPPPPPPEDNISLADIMLKLNSLLDIPSKINDIANDLKQIKVIQEQTAKMSQELRECQGQMNKMEEKVSTLQENDTETQQQMQFMAREISDLKAEVQQLKQSRQEPPPPPQSDLELLKVKADMLKNNLIIEGIREPRVDGRNAAYYQARSFVKNTLGISYAEIDRAYRLGSRRGANSQPRPLLVRFTRQGDRMDVWEARYKLSSSGNLFIREDLPVALRPIQAALGRVAQIARKHPQKYQNVMIREFRLHINDKSYGVDDLERLPKDLRPSVTSTPGNTQVVIFFGKDSRFSNHHSSKFVIQGTSYASMEQYLADKRATLADRQDLRDRALASDDPRDAKKVLNLLHGDSSDEEWANQRRDILFDGLLAKFEQNEDLRKYLLSSERRTLGEASRNKTWGIGLTLTDKGRLDTRNWNGENLLGTTLMEVRDRLAGISQTTDQPTNVQSENVDSAPGDPAIEAAASLQK